MHDILPTTPESSIKHHDSFLQGIATTSIDDQAINSWIARGTHGDPMEVLDPQLFQGALGQYGSHITHGHNDMFATMVPYHESDNTTPALTSHNSSASLFPFPNTTINCDTWMDLSPTTSKNLLSMNDRQQAPDGLEGQAIMTDATETATQSSPNSNSIPSVNLPAERGKTVLTLENLDPETRSEVLDLLLRRKVITTIEIV